MAVGELPWSDALSGSSFSGVSLQLSAYVPQLDFGPFYASLRFETFQHWKLTRSHLEIITLDQISPMLISANATQLLIPL